MRHFLGHAITAQSRAAARKSLFMLIRDKFGNAGMDRPRTHGIDRDALLAELDSQSLGEADNAVLGCGKNNKLQTVNRAALRRK